ncbi:MAG TPA: APC family permease [Bacteroidales bacterium]|nr:APC family permease [Bacteroidales bacterium]
MSENSASGPGLRRVLRLPALVLYGIILIQPTAPMPLYGAAATLGKGHVVTAVLIGMFAMLFTAISYGRMANAYPNAGSAYTYVTRAIHPSLGYFIGWGMIFDYIMNPIICVIWASKASMNFIPEIPFAAYAVFYAVLFTGMNLRGIESSARTNTVIATGLGIVIVLFLSSAVRYLLQQPALAPGEWSRPFYDPQTFSFDAVSAGASLAVLTYIGFDGISTLSEEVHNPRKNILRASVLVCLITGVLASVQVYFAQMVWPGTDFPDQDTAFVYIAGRAGGQWLFYVINIALLIATIGSGSGAHLGAGRLLYGMGRDNAIPAKFFAHIDPKTRIPNYNIILIGVLVLAGAFLLTYSTGAQLLNFGALIAFMGVNASSFVYYFLKSDKKKFTHFIVPFLGFVVCFFLWMSLGLWAKIAGLCWLSLGLMYGAYRTSWFRKPLQFARIETDDENIK